MKKIIYTRSDGGLSVVHPVASARGPNESEDAFIARIRARAVPADAANVSVVEHTALPSDRLFRNGWTTNSGSITFNLVKCRELARGKIREVRKPKLEALESDYLKADEQGDVVEKARIAGEKQVLRDAPADPQIDSATDIAALKAVIQKYE